MKIVTSICSLIWRTWFLLTFAIPFLITLPFTLFLTLNTRFYPLLYFLLHYISKWMFYASAIIPNIENQAKLDPKKQYIFCSNHSSILDVPFMFFLSKKPISFIGKKSLAKIPIFGYYYRTFNVLVNRKSIRDSYLAFQKAGEHIKQGKNIVIFPEGGIINNKQRLSRFKNGLFRLAIEQNITIIPITFADNSWIFPSKYTKGKPARARVTIHKKVSTEGKNIESLKEEVYNIIDQQLIEYENRR